MRKITMILGLVLISCSSLFAQANKKSITGKVTTETGEALSGVTVSEVAGVAKTLTDEKGVYTIQVNSKTTTLRFSYVGYKESDANISNKSVANISLSLEAGALAEVVVVGYGVQQKKAFTGSASKIDAKEFSQLVTPSVDRQLAGRAAGVQVVAGGGDVGAPARK
jgi:Zn-dependent membrane protease YugP